MKPISEVYLGDCMEYMAGKPDKFWDLAVVDPQTGQGEGKKHATRGKGVQQRNGSILNIKTNHAVKDWDEAPPPQEYYDELFRVSKHQIIMCENYLHFKQKSSSPGRIVWNLLRDNDFSACQIMWTSLTNKIEYFEYLWSGMMQGVAINSRLQKGDKSQNECRIHPSQKPVLVYHHLLSTYTKAGYKILDTHVGSGSHRIAAYHLGLDFYGCEIDFDFWNDQEDRFKTAIAEPLFDSVKPAVNATLFDEPTAADYFLQVPGMWPE